MIIKRETGAKEGNKIELRIISLDKFENNQTFAMAVKSYSVRYQQERISNYDTGIMVKNMTNPPVNAPFENHYIYAIIAVLGVALVIVISGMVRYLYIRQNAALKRSYSKSNDKK